MNISKYIFPVGAILTLLGVLLYAALERSSFVDTQDWLFSLLAITVVPALLLGTLLAILGAVLDLRRLSVREKKHRGLSCWAVAGISFALLMSFGNVHDWTFSFFFLARRWLLIWRGLPSGPLKKTPQEE